MALLVQRAHADGLAIAQKNTLELAPDVAALGIEYDDAGLQAACSSWSNSFSIVERDL